MLRSNRPLAVLDLEATGTDPDSARIIQVAILSLVEENGTLTLDHTFESLVDPGVPIPSEVSDLTGITDADVQEQPSLPDLEHSLSVLLGEAHLIGYNSRGYDLPLLQAEYERHGMGTVPGPEDRCHLDVFQLEKALQSRSLRDVYHKYYGSYPDDTHQALGDAKATCKILREQLNTYEPDRDFSAVCEVAQDDYLDSRQRLKREDGDVVVHFGDHYGTSLKDLFVESPGYVKWMYKEMENLRPYIEGELGTSFHR